MAELHTLWPISEQSFRVMIAAHAARLTGSRLAGNHQDVTLLGDALIRGSSCQITRRVPIDAPMELVWRCVAQIYRGAGTFGWRRLEHGGRRSADRILPDIPPPQVGDRAQELLELIIVNPGHELVWKNCNGLSVLGIPITELTLDYALQSDANNSCVLTIRMRARCGAPTAALQRHVLEIIDFVLPLHQLQRLKALAEAAARSMPRLSNDAAHSPPRE